MITENIHIGENVVVHISSSINNIRLGNSVRVAKRCSLFGGNKHVLEIGDFSYVGMNSFIDGFNAKVIVGDHVSIAPNVCIVSGSGPNASTIMQRVMPVVKAPVSIGNNTWIGAGVFIMPGVELGECCVVAANSVVTNSFPSYSIIGGSPAKLIREFTQVEKDLLKDETPNYETNYANLQFESTLHYYRYQKILEVIHSHPHQRILELGSGPIPFNLKFSDFEKLTVVEPGKSYFKQAQKLGESDHRITFINDFFENVADQLAKESFDFIIIGGFLHEISNPDEVLQKLKKICGTHTVVHSYVPNARSFHRLLALESGIIESIYQMSKNDVIFDRKNIFDQKSFHELFAKNGYDCIETGSYFIKPFTNMQMHELILNNIVGEEIIGGLDKMIRYLPEMGVELFFTGSLKKTND